MSSTCPHCKTSSAAPTPRSSALGEAEEILVRLSKARNAHLLANLSGVDSGLSRANSANAEKEIDSALADAFALGERLLKEKVKR